MIIVHVAVNVKSDARQKFSTMMADFIEDTLKVKACHKFVLYQQVQDENMFGLYEEWESVDGFDAYTQTERFAQFRADLGALIAAPPISNRYQSQPL